MIRSFEGFSATVFFLVALGQVTQSSDYSCAVNNATTKFTFVSSSFSHSAFNTTANCSVLECDSRAHDCRTSQTPCYNFQTRNNTSYCAPASDCSLLETCNTNNDTCSTNTSVCVINSCCEPRARCLPLLFTTFCLSTSYPISCFSAVTASGYYPPDGTPTQQGDGLVDRPNTSGGTSFHSGGFPPQWVQLELPGWYNITAIALKVDQVPNGQTHHQISVGPNSSSMQIVNDLTSTTSHSQWLNFTYNPILASIRFVRVYTISSPSWVAWEKFIVYDF